MSIVVFRAILEKNQNMSRPVSITAARCVAWRAIVGDMKCFKALHGASEALAIAAIVKTHFQLIQWRPFPLLLRDALRCVA